MTGRPHARLDRLERGIEAALAPCRFVSYHASFGFVGELEQVEQQLLQLIRTESARAVALYEAFLAGCYEKAGEIDDSSATSTDGSLAVELTQHIVSTFGTALFRHLRGIPDRCPTCGSYKVGLRGDPDHPEAEPVPSCRACGWMKAVAASPGP